jgi:cytochrome c oxidase cbb3-type subunit III
MSDFISPGWSIYVAVISIASIAACALLLWFTIKARVPSDSKNTTGHVWDGDLYELNNPLPRWWMWLFVLTILFAVAYVFAYPALGSYPGMLKWSSEKELKEETQTASTELAPLYQKFAKMGEAELMANTDAMGIGQRIFLNNCSQCHGSDARGSKGFPNLADNDWLWGGEFDQIKESITKGRVGAMPALGAAIGNDVEQANLAQYVLSLSKAPHDAQKAAAGKEKFAICAACHGAEGKGNIAMGAPNLTDDIWLHGRSEAQIRSMIAVGKNNMMPAQEGTLMPEQIHILAAYVKKQAQKL